jgi:mycothiol system anti-sigma-R factor
MMPFEDLCEQCEERIQPYLDRDLDERERREAEAHLAACAYCARRYRFEETLRRFVRKACHEEMPPGLKAKLAALRTPLE